jgi:L-serine dehydratase
LRPCAGTGDPCPYTGFIKAMMDSGYSKEQIARTASLILKIGSVFRVGKVSTGCNMEGFGAGACAISAAFVYLKGGTARDMEKAMVLALSPTIGVPCTPRVMVPGLCATHIGGAILVGALAASLAVKTKIEVNVPIDVMVSMAAEVHRISAKEIVPAVVKFMQPFFKTNPMVEELIDEDIKAREMDRINETIEEAKKISKKLTLDARPITETLGEAVVGGSSQAVGSPTNAARIAHYLSKGNIKKVKVELYPELFARRGINMPGILMGAVFGSSTSDHDMYDKVMAEIKEKGIEVEVLETQEYQVQRITVITDNMSSTVDTLNRGGGRLVIRDASPSKVEAIKIAEKLGIVVVNP